MNVTLPEWLPKVVLRNIRVGACSFTLHFWREGMRSRWEVANMSLEAGKSQEDAIQIIDEADGTLVRRS